MGKAVGSRNNSELHCISQPRAYGQLLTPAEDGEEIIEAEKAGGCLFVARRQAPKVLEAVEKALHLVAPPVAHPVNQAAGRAVFFAWNDHFGPHFFDGFDKGVGWGGLAETNRE